MSEPRWIRFAETETRRPGLRTKCWRVEWKQSGAVIGWIRWETHWRGYVFEPCSETFYDATCLRDLAAFCEQRTSEQRSTWHARSKRA